MGMKPIPLIKRELKMLDHGQTIQLSISDDNFIICRIGLIYYYIPAYELDKPLEFIIKNVIKDKIQDIWQWVHENIKDAYAKHTDKKKNEVCFFLNKEFKSFEPYSRDGLEINFEIEPYTDTDTGELNCKIVGTKCI